MPRTSGFIAYFSHFCEKLAQVPVHQPLATKFAHFPIKPNQA
jgi:hypothetical protein